MSNSSSAVRRKKRCARVDRDDGVLEWNVLGKIGLVWFGLVYLGKEDGIGCWVIEDEGYRKGSEKECGGGGCRKGREKECGGGKECGGEGCRKGREKECGDEGKGGNSGKKHGGEGGKEGRGEKSNSRGSSNCENDQSNGSSGANTDDCQDGYSDKENAGINSNVFDHRPVSTYLDKIRYESIKADVNEYKVKKKFSFPTYLTHKQNYGLELGRKRGHGGDVLGKGVAYGVRPKNTCGYADGCSAVSTNRISARHGASCATTGSSLCSSHLVRLKAALYFKSTPFTIAPSLIHQNSKLTVMLKNIPNKYTSAMLINLLNEDHYGCYDFLYLRMDFLNECNVGYAFINFVNTDYLCTFYYKVHGRGWTKYSSNKIAEVTYASIQGIEALYRKFRNSPILH